ncbi:MAG TPA: hypothetical protein EYP33_04370 [Pyrodictium sp.]|nr:hypothetical protein [Pyrodictium sp.]
MEAQDYLSIEPEREECKYCALCWVSPDPDLEAFLVAVLFQILPRLKFFYLSLRHYGSRVVLASGCSESKQI